MKLQRVPVNFDVAYSGRPPGMVGSHAASLQRAPDTLDAKEFQGAYDGSKEFPRIILAKGETIAFTGPWIILLHGIGQTTDTAHNGHTAIAHGD